MSCILDDLFHDVYNNVYDNRDKYRFSIVIFPWLRGDVSTL